MDGDGQSVALDSPKQRVPLATLLAHKNQVVSADGLGEGELAVESFCLGRLQPDLLQAA